MTKGQDTKHLILEAGLQMASRLSLESVSIGALAKETGMSKSGLFAHFKSKENLQIELLKYAAQVFTESVLIPALKIQAGMSRIKALVQNWVTWSNQLKGGCIFVSASTEFSDRPGRVRDYLLHQQEEWIESLSRIAASAVRAGDFRKDIDSEQFAFELYSLLLGFYFYHKLLRDSETGKRQRTALEQLLAKYRTPVKEPTTD